MIIVRFWILNKLRFYHPFSMIIIYDLFISDLDARGSEEHDNLANERDLNRFILSGRYKLFS